MEAKELMIGDWVSYDGEYVKIEGITTDSGRYKYPFSVEYCDGRDFAHIAVLNVDPILLTEEMLLKNGFEWDDYWDEFCLKVDNFEYAIFWDLDGFFVEFAAHDKRVQIDYVHQLQNLMRLCGLSELADKLKIE